MTIKAITYNALVKGPRLLILGAVHGNEICGTQALYALINLLDTNQITLNQGHLTVIPICNPKAYAQNLRFVQRNLNRHLYPKPQAKAYEDSIDPILCNYLSNTDYLLDLHSYASRGDAFIFLGGNNDHETQFARALGIKHFIYGWQSAYQNTDTQVVTHTQNKVTQQRLESMGTTEYARSHGAQAITLECGQHLNTDAPSIGLIAALRALNYLKMLNPEQLPKSVPHPNPSITKPLKLKSQLSETLGTTTLSQVCIKMSKAYYKQHPGKLVKPWQHLDFVMKGEPLASFDNGSKLIAEHDGFVILPKEASEVGSEWFYLGKQVVFPSTENESNTHLNKHRPPLNTNT